MPILKKGQLTLSIAHTQTPAEQFYALAAYPSAREDFLLRAPAIRRGPMQSHGFPCS